MNKTFMTFSPYHSKALIRSICEQSFYEFVKRAWKYIETAEYIDGWHIEVMCLHLQALYERKLSTSRLIINIPPRMAKSLIASALFPTWIWLKDPTFKLFTGSHSDDNRTRDSIASRNLMNQDWFRYHWGDIIKFKADQNQKTWYENSKGGKRISYTVSGGITGSGGDGIDLDDPLDINDRTSKVKRDQTNLWIGQGLSTRLNDKIHGLLWIIMQRLHEDDPTGYLMRVQKELWTHLYLPMEFEPENRCVTSIFKDPRTKSGELLWHKTSQRELQIIKMDLGSDYAGQYQQRPCNAEGNTIKREWFKYYNKNEKDKLNFDFIIQSWDTAWETKKENDFSVCTTWGVFTNKIYLIDHFRAKIEYVELKRKMKQLYDMYKPMHVYVEDAASGKSAIQELTRESFYPIVPIKLEGKSKEIRVQACTPLFENGQVFLPENEFWVHNYIEELVIFPHGNHDDQVDSTSQALNQIKNKFGYCPFSIA